MICSVEFDIMSINPWPDTGSSVYIDKINSPFILSLIVDDMNKYHPSLFIIFIYLPNTLLVLIKYTINKNKSQVCKIQAGSME